jgi:hypothetical protein
VCAGEGEDWDGGDCCRWREAEESFRTLLVTTTAVGGDAAPPFFPKKSTIGAFFSSFLSSSGGQRDGGFGLFAFRAEMVKRGSLALVGREEAIRGVSATVGR